MSEGCDFSFTRDDAKTTFDDSAWADHDEGFDGFWSDLLERRGVDGDAWTCPHDGVDGGDCVFHRDSGAVGGDRQAETLVEALDSVERPATDGGCRRGQFVGATFGALNLSGRDLSLPDGARVDFLAATFAGEATFEDCSFGPTKLNDATFERSVSFDRAAFDGPALLLDSTFETRTSFDDATFEGKAYFDGAQFGAKTTLNGARFDDTVSFDDTEFDGRVELVQAEFEAVEFDAARCRGSVTFYGSTVERTFRSTGTTFDEPVYLTRLSVDDGVQVEDCRCFGPVSLNDARVANTVLLRDCRFYRDEADATIDDIEDADPVDSDVDPVSFERIECGELDVANCRLFRELNCEDATVDTLYVARSKLLGDAALGTARIGILAGLDSWFGGTTDLVGTRVSRGELIDTEFEGLLNCNQATLTKVDLSESQIGRATFQHADLTGANLSGLDLRGDDFSSATLSRAVLYGADLRGADLSGATLGNVHVDDETAFLHPPVGSTAESGRLPSAFREAVPLLSSPSSCCAVDPAFEPTGDLEAVASRCPEADVDGAMTLYRTIETVAGGHSRPTLQSRAFVRGQDLRYERLRRVEPFPKARYLFSRLQRGVFVYGESFARVVVVSLALIFAFGLLYPLGGWAATVGPDGAATPLTYARVAEEPVLL